MDHPTSARRLSSVLLALVLGVVLTGCGSGGSAADVAQPPPPADDPAAVGPPVLQVEQVGGLQPVEAAFASVPELTVYDDGRAVVAGPVPAIFPGPALPNLRVQRLGEDGVPRLVELAREAGLLTEPPDYGELLVADATTTRLALSVAGERWVHEVYALGFDIGLPSAPEASNGLTPQAQQARQVVQDFLDAARQLVAESGPDEAYVPPAFALTTVPAPAGEAPLERQVLAWPLPEVDLAQLTGCTVVDDAAADVLRSTLQEANTLTLYTQAGNEHSIAVRPLLPGESGC